jgi:hypothetical protein
MCLDDSIKISWLEIGKSDNVAANHFERFSKKRRGHVCKLLHNFHIFCIFVLIWFHFCMELCAVYASSCPHTISNGQKFDLHITSIFCVRKMHLFSAVVSRSNLMMMMIGGEEEKEVS